DVHGPFVPGSVDQGPDQERERIDAHLREENEANDQKATGDLVSEPRDRDGVDGVPHSRRGRGDLPQEPAAVPKKFPITTHDGPRGVGPPCLRFGGPANHPPSSTGGNRPPSRRTSHQRRASTKGWRSE